MVYVDGNGNIIQSTRPWTISGTIWTVLDIVVRFFETLSPFSTNNSQMSIRDRRSSRNNGGNRSGSVRGGGYRPPRSWGPNVRGLDSVVNRQPPPACTSCCPSGSCG